ncbi:MAG: hypothetical protein Q8R13_04000 [bacterium]|nr:hypothetical protein [bacterium]MDZ4296296.1 hypothetical protein [Patescibacteria group bacterium]
MFINLRRAIRLGPVIGIGIMAALAAWLYWDYRTSEEYQIKKEIEAIKKEIAEDPYGGETPEETLRLFIDALKKGDTDLAAKYFVYDEQEEWREDLTVLKQKDFIDDTVSDLEQLILSKETEDRAFYTLVDENNVVTSQLILHRDPQSRKWKIAEF